MPSDRPATEPGGFGRWSEWLVVVTLVPFVALVLEVGARVKFPWDAYIWSESPFLTNMLSLNAGHSIYGPPSDANSFVYSPGLDYFCYGILHPFGRDLDIRFCRGVVVAFGLTGCVAASRAGGRLLSVLGVGGRAARTFLPFAVMLTALVLAKNYTADVCHPDNLMVAHVVLTFCICWSATTNGDLRLALAAVAFGSLGVLTKQTAVGTGVAALVGLLLVRSEYRTLRSGAALVSATLVTTGAALALLLGPPNSRFWTFELLRGQGMDWEKLNIYYWGISAFSHRVLLYTLAPIAWVWLYQRPEAAARRFATLWLVFALGACGPALAAYVKSFGSWNNLGIFDVWSALLVLPALYGSIAENVERRDDPEPSFSRAVVAASMGLLIVLLLAVIPTRASPTPAHYAAARELEAELLRAHKAGERVLVAHGTAALIHAGYRDVPLDRANSLLELMGGREISRVLTAQRIFGRVYDRIYLNMGDWYAGFWPVIALGYEEAGILRAPSARPEATGAEGLGDRFGYQPIPKVMDQEVRIYRRRPPP